MSFAVCYWLLLLDCTICWCFVCLFVGLRSVLVVTRWSRWVGCVSCLACVCFDCLLDSYFWLVCLVIVCLVLNCVRIYLIGLLLFVGVTFLGGLDWLLLVYLLIAGVVCVVCVLCCSALFLIVFAGVFTCLTASFV